MNLGFCRSTLDLIVAAQVFLRAFVAHMVRWMASPLLQEGAPPEGASQSRGESQLLLTTFCSLVRVWERGMGSWTVQQSYVDRFGQQWLDCFGKSCHGQSVLDFPILLSEYATMGWLMQAWESEFLDYT